MLEAGPPPTQYPPPDPFAQRHSSGIEQPQVIDYANRRLESQRPLYDQGQGDFGAGGNFSEPPPSKNVASAAPETSFSGALSKVGVIQICSF